MRYWLQSDDALALHYVYVAVGGKFAELFDVLARSWPVNL
jgi:hypothetical protein